jgi:hypothetical protein
MLPTVTKKRPPGSLAEVDLGFRNAEPVPPHRQRYRITICVDDDNARLHLFMPGTMPSRQVGAGFVRGVRAIFVSCSVVSNDMKSEQ